MLGWHTNHSARHENRGANTGTSLGVTLTTGAANTMGSWVDIGATTGFAYEQITVCLGSGDTAQPYLVNIGINVGGNRYIIAEKLKHTQRIASGYGNCITLPLYVPAGAQLSAQAQSVGASVTIRCVIIGSSSGLMGMPGFSQLIPLYTDSASSGVNLDPGGTAHTEPGYTQLIASSAKRIAGIFGMVGPAGDVSRAAVSTWLMDVAFGGAGSEQGIIQDFLINAEVTTDMPQPIVFGPFACDIPASSRFAARVRSSNATAGDRVIDLGLYGLVP